MKFGLQFSTKSYPLRGIEAGKVGSGIVNNNIKGFLLLVEHKVYNFL